MVEGGHTGIRINIRILTSQNNYYEPQFLDKVRNNVHM